MAQHPNLAAPSLQHDGLTGCYPARLAQQPCDLAVAVAAVLLGKLNNIGRQTLLVLTTARDLALRRAVLPKRRTGPTLGDMQNERPPCGCVGDGCNRRAIAPPLPAS